MAKFDWDRNKRKNRVALNGAEPSESPDLTKQIAKSIGISKVHGPYNMSPCTSCGRLFYVDNLDEHRKRCSPPERFEKVKCPVCGVQVDKLSKAAHMRHSHPKTNLIRNPSGGGWVKCRICGRKVKHHAFKKHLKSEHARKRLASDAQEYKPTGNIAKSKRITASWAERNKYLSVKDQPNTSNVEENGAEPHYKAVTKASMWNRKAAAQGISAAIINLCNVEKKTGYCHDGLLENQQLAGIRSKADNGDAQAQSELGYTYESGRYGLVRDEAEAVKWYLKAAENGHAEAQFRLACRYYLGRGVPQNNFLAVVWYRKAAEQGHVSAHNSLGRMYENGFGVSIDMVEAVKWYGLAAARGNELAINNMKRLSSKTDLETTTSASFNSVESNPPQPLSLGVSLVLGGRP